MSDTRKLRDILSQATSQLAGSSESAYLDAQLLMAHLLNCERLDLLLRADSELTESQIEAFNKLVLRRASKEPVAYIIGRKEFWGLNFLVDSNVLIPRPDTEILVEKALNYLRGISGPLKIADLGTGSGAIAVAVAFELMKEGRTFHIFASDLAESALRIAQKNADSHGLSSKISFLQGAWFSAFDYDPRHRSSFNLILSNPPYLCEGDPDICDETRLFEPNSALYSPGIDGLDCAMQIIGQAASFMTPRSSLMLEISPEQFSDLSQSELVTSQFCRQEIVQDLAGRSRVLALYRESSL